MRTLGRRMHDPALAEHPILGERFLKKKLHDPSPAPVPRARGGCLEETWTHNGRSIHIKPRVEEAPPPQLTKDGPSSSAADADRARQVMTSLPPLLSPLSGMPPPNGSISADQKTSRRAAPAENNWCNPGSYWYVCQRKEARARFKAVPHSSRGRGVARNLASTLYHWKHVQDSTRAEGTPSDSACEQEEQRGPLAALAGF